MNNDECLDCIDMDKAHASAEAFRISKDIERIEAEREELHKEAMDMLMIPSIKIEDLVLLFYKVIEKENKIKEIREQQFEDLISSQHASFDEKMQCLFRKHEAIGAINVIAQIKDALEKREEQCNS